MRRVLEFDPTTASSSSSPAVTEESTARPQRRPVLSALDPGSNPYCRIGGNLAMNAAGPRAVKYGVTRDYVLGLRAVTGSGQEIRTGCRTTKGVTGYDLTRLLIGSGGTLALITEATLKLLPAPESVATLRCVMPATAPPSTRSAASCTRPSCPARSNSWTAAPTTPSARPARRTTCRPARRHC
jgi:D-lactate dehydrogenase